MKVGLLTDYVKTYTSVFTQEECEKAITEMEDAAWSKHTYHNATSDVVTTYDNDLSVAYVSGPAGRNIQDKLWDVINRYIRKDMGHMPWFDNWSGYSGVRFNKYDPTTEMRVHCDHIHTLFDGKTKGIPVLTVLGALNQDYTGGEFVMFEDREVEMPPGSVVVFPSNFLYPHEVRPIKSGIRYSYVSWVW